MKIGLVVNSTPCQSDKKHTKMFKQFQFLIKVLVVLCRELLEIFLKLFTPQKAKNVKGKLALISGQWIKKEKDF